MAVCVHLCFVYIAAPVLYKHGLAAVVGTIIVQFETCCSSDVPVMDPLGVPLPLVRPPTVEAS